jgi:amino acid adenylation domain-containing protein
MAFDPEIKSIREAIDAAAEAQKEAAFLIGAENGNSISFQELRSQSIALAVTLRSKGLETGDKAAFLMDNGLRSAQIFLGTMYGGYVAVPLNVRAGVVQLTYMLDHCDAKVVFVAPQYSELLHEALAGVQRAITVIETSDDAAFPILDSGAGEWRPAPPAGDDVALLMYSSGSTGKPKAAIHTHNSILAHGRNSIQAHQLTARDRSLLVLPLYHINAECVTLIPTLLSRGSVVVAQRFAVSRFWDWIGEYRVTWSALVPTIVSELVDWDDLDKARRAEAFARIRFFRSSSAPLAPTLHQQFLDKFNLPLIQAMGSTEGGNVFSNPVPPGVNKIGSPGLPWGFEARIVDREGADVLRGESGEVILRGAGLMRAYYKDAEGTSAVLDSEGWLHTGDLARQDEDGYFFVVGRSKELIIKGGVNIAPRQIDEVFESHPAVLEAAAVGVPDRYFGEDAIAFVVLRQGAVADERELLSFCETRLGHFKTPTRIHFLRELPKGPSGKVQRLRLLDPDVLAMAAAVTQGNARAGNGNETIRPGEAFGTPGGPSIEEVIATAWAKVLGVPDIDRDANFFAAGGHSLLAIQCLAKLREKLPISLSLPDFFQAGTVMGQAALVRQRMRAAGAASGPQGADESSNCERALLQQFMPAAEETIPHIDSTLPYPLSPAQQRLWFLELLNPDVPVYNEAEAVLLTGKLNVDALETALQVIVDRHDILRSTIEMIDEVPHAVVHGKWPLRIRHIDLSAMPQVARQSELDRLLVEEPRAPYRLELEPGIRVTLIRLGPEEHALILMMHHIICDWSSEGVIWRELSSLYASFLSAEPVDLPPLPVNHRDYAAWRQQQLESTSLKDGLAFWEQELRDSPALLQLPADRERTSRQSHRGGRLRRKLSATLTEALRKISREESASLFTIFAAALDTLLYRYTGSDDILLGVPLADRDQPELQAVIGFLLHLNVLRTRISSEMTFRELLVRVQKSVLDLYVHRSVPFDLLVQKLRPERNLSYSPLFQVMLNWRDRDQSLPFIGLEGLRIDSLMAHTNTSKFDLFVFATDTGDEIWIELEYNADLFDLDRIARMLDHYQTVLEAAAGDTTIKIDQLPLLTPVERDELLYEWNRTAAEYPADKCVHQLFEEQAEKTPDAVAVVFEDSALSYAELNNRANRLAHYLRKMGIRPDDRVAICVERGLEMVVALLAVLKAGGAYVPLDPAYPTERLRFMVRDSEAAALLMQEETRSLFEGSGYATKVIDVGDVRPWNDQSATNPNPAAVELTARNLAYVIYTSGSTGQPKGVMVEHRSLTNLICSMQKQSNIDGRATLLAVTTIAFDIAGLEIYLPLTSGACVRILSREAAMDGSRLRQEAGLGATIMQATPATWRMLLASGWNGDGRLQLLCGGEALSLDLAEKLVARSPEAWNMYGPTETTIWSLSKRLERGLHQVTIGRPIANTRVYILDRRGEPVPVGIAGELYIGGAGVARGYLNRPELTAERFLSDPFADEPAARMYRTGDLARYLPDGNIEFLGRNDFQVKLRGFRIELGEIEAVLRQFGSIGEAGVTLQTGTSGDQQLVAYYTTASAANSARPRPGPDALRSYLSARLPGYMIPAAFVEIDAMPHTPNGKLDRGALSRCEVEVRESQSPLAPVTPRSAAELIVLNVWQSVLGVKNIGIDDSFFSLGGYSLLALRAVQEINKRLGTDLRVAEFYQNPTISGVSKVLRNGAKLQTRLISLRPAQSEGQIYFIDAPPKICRLAECFDPGPALFATDMQADRAVVRAVIENRQEDIPNLEELARPHVDLIRDRRSDGPCVLVGYSIGGLLAFEAARQLRLLGREIDAVVILDTMAPRPLLHRFTKLTFARIRSSLARRTKETTDRLARRIKGNSSVDPSEDLAAFGPELDEYQGNYIHLPWTVFAKFASAVSRRYQCRKVEGIGILIRAKEIHSSHFREMGWDDMFTDGLRIFDSPGDHFSLVDSENVPALSQVIQSSLSQLMTFEPSGVLTHSG